MVCGIQDKKGVLKWNVNINLAFVFVVMSLVLLVKEEGLYW